MDVGHKARLDLAGGLLYSKAPWDNSKFPWLAAISIRSTSVIFE